MLESEIVFYVILITKKKTHFDYRFCRKGKVGSYKEEMPEKFIEKFDNWTSEYNRQNGTCIIP